MPRGRWKPTPESLAEEAFCVLIRGDKAQRSYPKSYLKQILANPDIRTPFLKLCMEFDDSLRLEKFRKGLQLVVQSVGTANVAKVTKIHRVTLYRMLAKGGNPSLENLMRVVRSLGMRPWVVDDEFIEKRQRVSRPKDVQVVALPKASTGRRIWTRSKWNSEPDDR